MQWEEVGLFLTAPVTGRRAGSGPRCCREQSMSRGGCWDLCHWPVTPSPSVEPRGGRGGMEASSHGAALPELRLDPRRVTRLEPPLPLPGEPRALNGAAPPTPHGSPRGPAPRPGGRSQGAGHRPAGNRNRARVSASRPRGHRGRRRVSLPTAKAPFPCREGRVSPAPGTQAQGRLRPAFSHVSSPQPAGRCGSGRDGFWDIWRTSGLTQRSPTFVAPGADVGQACASGRTAGGGAEAPAPSPRSSTGARLPSACRCGRGTRGAGHTGRGEHGVWGTRGARGQPQRLPTGPASQSPQPPRPACRAGLSCPQRPRWGVGVKTACAPRYAPLLDGAV